MEKHLSPNDRDPFARVNPAFNPGRSKAHLSDPYMVPAELDRREHHKHGPFGATFIWLSLTGIAFFFWFLRFIHYEIVNPAAVFYLASEVLVMAALIVVIALFLAFLMAWNFPIAALFASLLLAAGGEVATGAYAGYQLSNIMVEMVPAMQQYAAGLTILVLAAVLWVGFLAMKKYFFALLDLAAILAIVYCANDLLKTTTPEVSSSPSVKQLAEADQTEQVLLVIFKDAPHPLDQLMRTEQPTDATWQEPLGFYGRHNFTIYTSLEQKGPLKIAPLIETFRNNNYRSNVYQSYFDGLCTNEQGNMVVDNCQTYTAVGNLARSTYSLSQKVVKLAEWWAASLDIISLQPLPALGQVQMFEAAARDYAKYKDSRNLFVISTEMGGLLPAYDRRCALPPIGRAGREAEMLCAYRQLNTLLNRMDLGRTLVIIVSGPRDGQANFLAARFMDTSKASLELGHCDMTSVLLTVLTGKNTPCRINGDSKQADELQKKVAAADFDWAELAGGFAKTMGDTISDDANQR
jgi:hypothetical protein